MKRREFLQSSALMASGLLLARSGAYASILKASKRNLANVDAYDVVINSLSVSGAFVALSAAKRGLKVLVLERATNAAPEMTDTFNLVLSAKGIDDWDENLQNIFLPKEESSEVSNPDLYGIRNSQLADSATFLAGSVTKGILRELSDAGVDIMFMADIFGVYVDSDNAISGVAFATKQGTYRVKCSSFVDASLGNAFARLLVGSVPKIDSASFAIELENAKQNCPKNFSIKLKDSDIVAEFLRAKSRKDVGFLRFEVPSKNKSEREIERDARLIFDEVFEDKSVLPLALRNCFCSAFARDCSFSYAGELGEIKIKNFFVVENSNKIKSCVDISRKRDEAVKLSSKLVKYSALVGEEKLFCADGEINVKPFGKYLEEDGLKLPFSKIDLSELSFKKSRECDVFVAGIGTGGTYVLESAYRRGAKVFGAEYFNDFGGTKANGGVASYYWCLTSHPILKQAIDEARAEHAKGMHPAYAYSRIRARSLKSADIATRAIVCGALLNGSKLEGAFYCERSRIYRVKSKVAVDCTADADLSAFANVPFSQGTERSGISINYSRWNRKVLGANAEKKKDVIAKDYGIVDVTKISDFQRAMLVAHYESNFFDSYPQLTPREARRPVGMKTLTLRDAIEGETSPDIIAQAFSDYDPHNYPSGKFSRCAMVLPHFSHGYPVNIPYGCVVPKNIDGLLFGGRGISVSHDALQYTRMSGDVAILGEVEGRIAVDVAKLGGYTREFNPEKIISESKRLGYYTPDYGDRARRSSSELTQLLARKDMSALLWACLRDKSEIVPLLKKSFARERSHLTALALSWFGESDGENVILSDLKKNFEDEKKDGSRAEYLELYWRGNLNGAYWNINRDIAFLALSGSGESDRVIAGILAEMSSGGEPVCSKNNVYYANRIDLVLVPNYNRIGNLCFYAERRPSTIFAKDFERLLEDEHIKGRVTRNPEEARYGVYGAILEILVASAAARCGSVKGVEVLTKYFSDQHANLRAFARQELLGIYGEDLGFDVKAWLKLASLRAGKVGDKLSEKFA